MKKTIIAVFAVLAAASVAGAQETGWSFEGRNGAAVPLPTMERAGTPQRLVSMDGMSEEKLGALLRKAAKSNNKDSQQGCAFAGPIVLGDMVCGSECCVWDMTGGGEMTECHPIEPCFPVEKPDTKAAPRQKANPVTGLVSALKKAGKPRGPYEDCINYCIDAWQACNGDNCGDSYQRCINVCDNVVNKP